MDVQNNENVSIDNNANVESEDDDSQDMFPDEYASDTETESDDEESFQTPRTQRKKIKIVNKHIEDTIQSKMNGSIFKFFEEHHHLVITEEIRNIGLHCKDNENPKDEYYN